MEFDLEIKDYYNLHNGFNLILKPGVTYLVGPNGAGKTTLLFQIKDYLDAIKAPNIHVLNYSNLKHGGHNAMGKQLAFKNGDMNLLATLATSSEGEQVAINLGQFAKKLGNFIANKCRVDDRVFVLVDAIDSGASIDRLKDIRDFFNLVIKNEKRVEIYIVCAINCYELTKNARCINPRTGQEVLFYSYEDYSNWICNYLDTYKKEGN